VHGSGGRIAVLMVVKEQCCSSDTGETTQCTEARWTAPDDNDIVVGLRDGLGVDDGHYRQDGKKAFESHDGGGSDKWVESMPVPDHALRGALYRPRPPLPSHSNPLCVPVLCSVAEQVAAIVERSASPGLDEDLGGGEIFGCSVGMPYGGSWGGRHIIGSVYG
jgi:hypothetical protein